MDFKLKRIFKQIATLPTPPPPYCCWKKKKILQCSPIRAAISFHFQQYHEYLLKLLPHINLYIL